MSKLISFGWVTSILLLFLYSFTQIDLGLTLTRISFWQAIQTSFQQIGYFNRPLSTSFYLLIIFILYTLYFILLWLAKKDKLLPKNFWWLIGLTAGILIFSYPAFSHDIFNYIFDAKTVVVYHKNPYEVKPLDFPEDPMLGFMHWTHRPSVYPPFWIGLSIIPFVLGMGKFILQLFWFKAMMVVFWLGTIWLVLRISQILTSKEKIFNVVFFAFNPLVLIESLVSAHNDGVMIFLALLAFYLLVKQKTFSSLLSWIFSIGIKYGTLALFSIFLVNFWQKYRVKKVDYQLLNNIAILVMYLAIFAISYRLGLQPWYLLWVFPFVALMTKNRLLVWLTIGFSLGSLLRYVPFLYSGHWNPPIPMINLGLTIVFLGLGILVALIDINRSPGKISLS